MDGKFVVLGNDDTLSAEAMDLQADRRHALRPTDSLRRLFLEERRRPKIVTNAFERRQLEALGRELERNEESGNGIRCKPSADARQATFSTTSRPCPGRARRSHS